MHTRDALLQNFITTAETAFRAHAVDEASKISIDHAFDTLQIEVDAPKSSPSRLPVCDHWLEAALAQATNGALAQLIKAFRDIEPQIQWRTRSGDAPHASASFPKGHANAMIVGPGGIEARTDVWIGASLLAPHVRYPDHTHPPEETYLVLTPGAFRQGDGPWFEPGVGGSFYNPPKILHAMRAGETPLFAFWLLRTKEV